jgi:hypothetical protein
MNDHTDPAASLAAIQASRKAVHDRVASDGWRYDLTYAALAAGMVGSQALDNPFNMSGLTLGILGMVVLFQTEARRTGLRVTGVSPRRARWVAIGLGLVMAAVMLGMMWIKRRDDGQSLVLITTAAIAVAFAVALIGSRIWRRVYRAEMGAPK